MDDGVRAPGAVLQVDGLRFGYGGNPLWTGWSLDVPAGATLLQGGDGCGKTTLLRVLAGELAPQAGTLVLHGTPLRTAPAAYRAQVFWADPRAPGWDANTPQGWFTHWATRWPRWDAAALEAHVEGFGLAPHRAKPMEQLSTGSRRKVLMAAALASGAPLALVDEPIAGLDRPSIAYLQQALAQVAQVGAAEGRAVVVAHYDALGGVPWTQVVALPELA